MIGSSVKKTAQDAARKSAAQIAKEPLEFLADFDTQLRSIEHPPIEKSPGKENTIKSSGESAKIEEQKDREKAKRLSLAYVAELEDIRRQKIFEELKRKILSGEEVVLEGIKELSPDQIQVLRALKEALEGKQSENKEKIETPLVEPVSKPKRGLFSGINTRVERLKRKSEMRLPPSG